MTALFAVGGRLFALKFVEEGKLRAGDMLHLFAEAADIIELAGCGNERILVFRHGFSEAEKVPFRELERAADAFSDGRGNVVLLSTGWLVRGSLSRSGFADSSESDAT